MKLKSVWIKSNELQDYLDKYQDKIKFILYRTGSQSCLHCTSDILLVIDMS